jgi:dolichyl-phosphate-mannose--protein O-mannosyl transferase
MVLPVPHGIYWFSLMMIFKSSKLMTIIIILLQIPLLILLMLICIGAYSLTRIYRNKYESNEALLITGIANGVVIITVDFIYKM